MDFINKHYDNVLRYDLTSEYPQSFNISIKDKDFRIDLKLFDKDDNSILEQLANTDDESKKDQLLNQLNRPQQILYDLYENDKLIINSNFLNLNVPLINDGNIEFFIKPLLDVNNELNIDELENYELVALFN